MRTTESIAPLRGREGSTLLEVMVALVMLALLVVPIARGVDSALGRAATLRGQAEEVAQGCVSHAAAEAWRWGPAVMSAAWLPGPRLELGVPVREGTTCVVGLWWDGWPLGEREVDREGRVSLRASDLRDLVGGELLVRVREAGETWGPPWRSVVPGSAGVLSPKDAAWALDEASSGMEHSPQTILHAPNLANPGIDIFPIAGGLDAVYPGLVLCAPGCAGGWCEAGPEGRAQSWEAEEGRALDVYF